MAPIQANFGIRAFYALELDQHLIDVRSGCEVASITFAPERREIVVHLTCGNIGENHTLALLFWGVREVRWGRGGWTIDFAKDFFIDTVGWTNDAEAGFRDAPEGDDGLGVLLEDGTPVTVLAEGVTATLLAGDRGEDLSG